MTGQFTDYCSHNYARRQIRPTGDRGGHLPPHAAARVHPNCACTTAGPPVQRAASSQERELTFGGRY